MIPNQDKNIKGHLANFVGPDCANLIMNYKWQLDHVEKMKPIINSIPHLNLINVEIEVTPIHYGEKQTFHKLVPFKKLESFVEYIYDGEELKGVKIEVDINSVTLRIIPIYNTNTLYTFYEPQFDAELNIIENYYKSVKYILKKFNIWKRLDLTVIKSDFEMLLGFYKTYNRVY
jgi:hypothetical protein